MNQSNIDLLTDDEKVIQAQKKMLAMSRICAGMTLEEMQNAPFDYKSLLEIVQRRDVRNARVPDEKEVPDCTGYDLGNNVDIGYAMGWNDCREEIISKMREQK